MYNDDELQSMMPRMSIEYRIEAGFLNNGTFDNIPENAFGAHIVTSFPIVGADGKFRNFRTSYDLFVGKVFEVKELLEQINNQTENNNTMFVTDGISEEMIKEYQEAGIQNVVSTKNGVAPLRYGDVAFATQEEMAAAITKINQTFKSVDILVQNAETPRIHR